MSECNHLVSYVDRAENKVRSYDAGSPVDCPHCLRKQLAEAKAIVDRLPKTADGVIVTPGMPIVLDWGPCISCNRYTNDFAIGDGRIHEEWTDADDGTIAIRFGDGSGSSLWKRTDVYSTMAAAQAARESQR